MGQLKSDRHRLIRSVDSVSNESKAQRQRTQDKAILLPVEFVPDAAFIGSAGMTPTVTNAFRQHRRSMASASCKFPAPT